MERRERDFDTGEITYGGGFSDIAAKIAAKLTEKTASKLASKAAEKLVEKGAGKVVRKQASLWVKRSTTNLKRNRRQKT